MGRWYTHPSFKTVPWKIISNSRRFKKVTFKSDCALCCTEYTGKDLYPAAKWLNWNSVIFYQIILFHTTTKPFRVVAGRLFFQTRWLKVNSILFEQIKGIWIAFAFDTIPSEQKKNWFKPISIVLYTSNRQPNTPVDMQKGCAPYPSRLWFRLSFYLPKNE